MPATITRATIAYGDAGVMDTLRIMQRVIDGAMDDPLVVSTARALAAADGPMQQLGAAVRIRAWMQRAWRFVEDPLTREHLEDAGYLLRQYQQLAYIPGDCDEAAILGATLGKAVGLTATLTVLAFDTGDTAGTPRYSHVFASLLTTAGQVITLDITKPSHPVARVVRQLTVYA